MAKRGLQRREPVLPAGREITVALAQLETDLGGRSCIIAALALAPLTKDSKHMLGMLADPANETRHLVEICQDADMLPGKLMAMVDEGLRASGNIRARFHISKQAAVVVADVMKRGAPHEDHCSRCQGIGEITDDPTPAEPNPGPKLCPACNGLKMLLYPADPDARKLALDLTGLMPKAGGVSITNQQLAVGAIMQGSGDLDTFQAALDQVLFGQAPAPAIEAEIVEPPPPTEPAP